MCEVDVLVENYVLIDWEIYELWIKGLSVTEAVVVMRERGILNEYPGVTQDLLVSDLNDHYRLFTMLENLLMTVGHFAEQSLYQMTPETQEMFIEKYYSLDGVLCREILGKKLSSRLRKDLDELSEKTGVHLKSCRRQFDNIKRIFKTIEDMPGSFVVNIQKTFHLSKDLSETYASIILLSSFKFEMNKKKLSFVSFESIKTICLVILENWMEFDDESEPALDKEFLLSLKDLRTLIDKDKEHRNIVASRLQSLQDLVSTRACTEIESNFKTLTRNFVAMAQSFASSRELRDFFIHLMDKVVDPLKHQLKLEKCEAEQFLRAYTEAVTGNVLLVDENIKNALRKYMDTLTTCTLTVF